MKEKNVINLKIIQINLLKYLMVFHSNILTFKKLYITLSIFILFSVAFVQSPYPSDPLPSNSTNSTNITNSTSNNSNINYSDVIIPNIYYSALNEKQRDEYMFWIKWKNGFVSAPGSLSTMTKAFEPQSDTYYETIFKEGWVFYLFAGSFVVVLLGFLVLRICFGKCKGPKSLIDNVWYARSAWIITITGFSVAMTFISISFYNNLLVSNRVQEVSKFTKEQSTLLETTLQNISEGSKNSIKLNYSLFNNTSNVSNLTLNVYGYDKFKIEAGEMKNKTNLFAQKISDLEGTRYNYSISIVIILPILSAITLIFYFWKKPIFILILSVLFLAMAIPHFVMMGINTSYFFLSIDICENLNKIVTNKTIPIIGEGVGYYVSCPSKSNITLMKTARYQIYSSFDSIINDLNTTLNTTNKASLGPYKRNDSYFIGLIGKYNNTNIDNGLKTLVELNKVLRSVQNLVDCSTAYSFIDYVEEHFCYLSISQIYNTVAMGLIGILGLIIMAVGVNKLVIVIDPKYYKMKSMTLINETMI